MDFFYRANLIFFIAMYFVKLKYNCLQHSVGILDMHIILKIFNWTDQ